MKKIYTIIMGYNKNNLFGSENDAILLYNLFYRFYLDYSFWEKPIIFLNKNVVFNNLIDNINNINITSDETIIIIYFSGHSSKCGKLQFFDNEYSNIQILKKISKNTNIFFIIDSCFSKKFIIKEYDKIKILRFIVSSYDDQTSKEIVIEYDHKMFLYKKLKYIHNKIVIGIFTLYFYKLVNIKNLYNIDNWKNKIINNPLWKLIENKYNQQIYYYQK
jgi:hypothetical protein